MTAVPGVNATAATQRRNTSLVYYSSFIALGMLSGVLGPSLDVFKDRTGAGNSAIANLFTAWAIGYMTGGALSGRLFDRRRGNPLLAAGLVGSALVMALTAHAGQLLVLALLMLLLGIITSSIDTGGNTLLPWLHGDRVGPWMIALHAAFGVGSAVVPLLLAYSRARTDGINLGLYAVGGLCVLTAVSVARRPSPEHPVHSDEHSVTRKPVPSRAALVACAGFFFCYVGLEIGFGGWIFTYGTDAGMSKSAGSLITSVFWWSFTAGRVLGIPLARLLDARRQLVLDIGIALAGTVLLIISAQIFGSRSNPLLWIATVVIGIGLATMFPVMINLASERVAITGSVTSWFIAGSGAGSAVIPKLIGVLFGRAGTQILPGFLLATVVLTAGAAMVAAHHLERH